MSAALPLRRDHTPVQQMEAPAPCRSSHRATRHFGWVLAIPLTLLLLLFLSLAVLDEPLRQYAEEELNDRIEGYAFHIGKLHLNPIALSLDLQDVSVTQWDDPSSPVAHVQRWHASIHWRELWSGHVVSDHRVDRPAVTLRRPQVAKEILNDLPTKDQRWQEAVLALYPLKINEFTLADGELTYHENDTAPPLRVSHLNVRASNIRNVRSDPGAYPSAIHIDAMVFDKGRLSIDGQADFFAEPTPAIKSTVDLQGNELSGRVEQTNTWDLVATLLRDAFFEAILPGFEGRGKRS